MDFKALKLGLDLGTDADSNNGEQESVMKGNLGKRNTGSVTANTPVAVNSLIYTSDMIN